MVCKACLDPQVLLEIRAHPEMMVQMADLVKKVPRAHPELTVMLVLRVCLECLDPEVCPVKKVSEDLREKWVLKDLLGLRAKALGMMRLLWQH